MNPSHLPSMDSFSNAMEHLASSGTGQEKRGVSENRTYIKIDANGNFAHSDNKDDKLKVLELSQKILEISKNSRSFKDPLILIEGIEVLKERIKEAKLKYETTQSQLDPLHVESEDEMDSFEEALVHIDNALRHIIVGFTYQEVHSHNKNQTYVMRLTAAKVDEFKKFIFSENKSVSGITPKKLISILASYTDPKIKEHMLDTFIEIGESLEKNKQITESFSKTLLDSLSPLSSMLTETPASSDALPSSSDTLSDSVDTSLPLDASLRSTLVLTSQVASRRIFPFVLSEERVTIMTPEKVGEGSFKLILGATPLDASSPNMIASLIVNEAHDKMLPDTFDPRKSGVEHPSVNTLINESNIEAIHREVALMHMLHNLCKDDPWRAYLAHPYEVTCLTTDQNKYGQDVQAIGLLQKRYDGDGRKLVAIPAREQCQAFRDIARGLACLHNVNQVHMDIKPENILFKRDSQNQEPIECVVADFGGIREKGIAIGVHTPKYCPPEFFDENHPEHDTATPEKDCYAFGGTIYKIISNKNLIPPYKYAREAIRHEIQELSRKTPTDEDTTKCSMLLIAQQLTATNPADRITCREAERQLDALLASS